MLLLSAIDERCYRAMRRWRACRSDTQALRYYYARGDSALMLSPRRYDDDVTAMPMIILCVMMLRGAARAAFDARHAAIDTFMLRVTLRA